MSVLIDRIPRRTAGRAMVAIGVLGVLVALAGTVVAWGLVGDLGSTVDESLVITDRSVDTIEDTIVVADQVVADVAAALGALGEVLEQLRTGVADVDPVLGDVVDLTTEVPAALTEFQATLDRVAGAAADVDQILVQLSRLPLAPDYDPDTTMSAQLRRLSDDLDPVVSTLASARGDVRALRDTSEELGRELGSLASEVRSLVRRLDQSAELTGRYREQAGRAGALAAESRDDLERSVTSMRILILLGGAVFAAGQLVPLWLGTQLLGTTVGDLTATSAEGSG